MESSFDPVGLFTKEMMKTMKNDPRLRTIENTQKRCQELMKITSLKWKEIDQDQKSKYEALSQKDLQRHTNQLN